MSKTPTYLRPIRIGMAIGTILIILGSSPNIGSPATIGLIVLTTTLILFVEEKEGT